MKVIIDSGSTKADWVLLANTRISKKTTIGLNPITSDASPFLVDYNKNPFPNPKEVKEVYYYGAGCSTTDAIKKVQKALKTIFPAAIIDVKSDLIGAAFATSNGKPAVVSILGTGSNSCLFNGQHIIDQIPNLGYILGDEGAGFAIGKALISAFFYRELSDELNILFQDKYKLTRDVLIQKIYQSNKPNYHIASFAKFAVEHAKHNDIQYIIYKVFESFTHKHLIKYKIMPSIPFHFVGTIAYVFRHELMEILEQNHLNVGSFLRKPIDGLVNYHQQLIHEHRRS